MNATRNEMITYLWNNIEPSIKGLYKMIEELLDTLTTEQLRTLYEARINTEEPNNES